MSSGCSHSSLTKALLAINPLSLHLTSCLAMPYLRSGRGLLPWMPNSPFEFQEQACPQLRSLLVSSHQELVCCSLRWILPTTVVNLFLWLGSLWFTYAKHFAIKLPQRAKQAFMRAAEGLCLWLNRVFCFCSHGFFITALLVLILGLQTGVTISFHEMVWKYREKECWWVFQSIPWN